MNLKEDEIININGGSMDLCEIVDLLDVEEMKEAVFNVYTGEDKEAVNNLIEDKVASLYKQGESVCECDSCTYAVDARLDAITTEQE